MYIRVVKLPIGLEQGFKKIDEITDLIYVGAMVFLKRMYVTMGIFIWIVFFILWIGLHGSFGLNTGIAFVAGAVSSILCGLIGMKSATRANGRTTWAAKTRGAAIALRVSFLGGSVMGLSVASLGLMGVGILFLFFRQPDQVAIINGFAMGASSIALFARIGGGIYTKTADVGADLVGKIEAGIPEDDPRNPAVIADNVGDNVGDVAGMGADIFESYVGSMIATIAIASLSSLGSNYLIFPLLASSMGLFASLIAVFGFRIFEKLGPQKALNLASYTASFILLAGSYILTQILDLSFGVFSAMIIGNIAGVIIGLIAEYYTSGSPTIKIARSSQTGVATNIITGLSVAWRVSSYRFLQLPEQHISHTTRQSFFMRGTGLYGLVLLLSECLQRSE
jgi:K(+)-stimulated pyrophosphate-energized sodium pump